VDRDGDDVGCARCPRKSPRPSCGRIVGRDHLGNQLGADRTPQANWQSKQPRLAELKQKPDAYQPRCCGWPTGSPGRRWRSRQRRTAAEYLREQGKVELAENVLQRRSDHPIAFGGGGRCGLAELYEADGLVYRGGRDLQRLAKTSAGVVLPGRNGQTAEQVAQRRLEHLPKPAAPPRFPAPPWRQALATRLRSRSAFAKAGDRPSRFLENHVLYVSQRDRSCSAWTWRRAQRHGNSLGPDRLLLIFFSGGGRTSSMASGWVSRRLPPA